LIKTRGPEIRLGQGTRSRDNLGTLVRVVNEMTVLLEGSFELIFSLEMAQSTRDTASIRRGEQEGRTDSR